MTSIENSKRRRLSVVFSFWNEEENLNELITRVRATLDKEVQAGKLTDYEMIFVNDASTDRSLEILRTEMQRRRDIRVVNMSRNFGVSPCVMAGFRHATGDAAVYLDADLQDPPELMHEMIEKWLEGHDVVHTVRRSRAGESKVKMMITKIGYRILKRFSRVEIEPNSGDYKLISRRALNQIVRHNEHRPFMRALVSSVGFRQTRVLYDRDARFSGDTKFPVFSYAVISNFFDSALISFSDLPLKLVSLAGVVLSIISFILLGDVLIEKMLGRNLPGWTAIMATITFFSGIQFIALGILGLYISSIFIETKQRPTYIVEDIEGFEDAKPGSN